MLTTFTSYLAGVQKRNCFVHIHSVLALLSYFINSNTLSAGLCGCSIQKVTVSQDAAGIASSFPALTIVTSLSYLIACE